MRFLRRWRVQLGQKELMGQVSFLEVPELSFTENDNDPLVVQVHIIG
jgi:hypothetical protein